MTHLRAEKRALFWPKCRPDAPTQTMPSMPGLVANARATFPPTDAASTWAPASLSLLNASLSDLSTNGQRLDLPDDTIAIGIAADSIIHACDIFMGGRGDEVSRWRLTPGSPYIGCLEPGIGHVIVTLPNAVPFYQIGAPGSVVCADSNAAYFGTGSGRGPSWPLCLEIIRGCTLPQPRGDLRAPMFSQSIFEIDNGETGQLIACVDGRSKVDIEVINYNSAGGSVTFSVDQLLSLIDNGFDNGGAIGSSWARAVPLDSIGTLTEVIALGEERVYSFSGTPFTLLRINLAAAADNCNVQVRVVAYD